MDHNRTSTAFELLCLGTGSAFTTGVDNWQSNFFLSRAGEPKGLLIDCGGDCRHAMAEQGLSAMDVEAVYISHPHADHIGGLEWLAFATFFDPRYTGRPLMWTSDVWVNSLWEDSLRRACVPSGAIRKTRHILRCPPHPRQWSPGIPGSRDRNCTNHPRYGRSSHRPQLRTDLRYWRPVRVLDHGHPICPESDQGLLQSSHRNPSGLRGFAISQRCSRPLQGSLHTP